MKVLIDEGGYMPVKAHVADGGFDLFSTGEFVVQRNAPAIIDTKVHIDIPQGFVGLILPKSGLNVNHNILSFGVIDSGYEGSIKVKLYKLDNEEYHIHKGDKISQIVITPISSVSDLEKATPETFYKNTERGNNGFGSTGR